MIFVNRILGWFLYILQKILPLLALLFTTEVSVSTCAEISFCMGMCVTFRQ